MKECTNPQYIVRSLEPGIDTELYSVEPGAPPVFVNQVPAGKPTISSGSQADMIQAVSKLLAEKGFCKMPESLDAPTVEEVEDTSSTVNVPEGLGALGNNISRHVEQQTQAVEMIPATPDNYSQNIQAPVGESFGAGVGASALFALPVALWGAHYAFSKASQQMFPVNVNPVVKNYEDQIPDNIYTPAQPVAPVASATVPEPSPWTRPAVHAGNPYQASHFGRNELPKLVRNDSEMTRNENRNEPKWAEMTSEMKSISPEMTPLDSERVERVKQRLSGLYQKPETLTRQPISDEMKSEIKPISGYFDPFGDLTQAKTVYFQLRGQGISTAVDLGGAIFGIRGGDKWSTVSPILQSWNKEWEESNG